MGYVSGLKKKQYLSKFYNHKYLEKSFQNQVQKKSSLNAWRKQLRKEEGKKRHSLTGEKEMSLIDEGPSS